MKTMTQTEYTIPATGPFRTPVHGLEIPALRWQRPYLTSDRAGRPIWVRQARPTEAWYRLYERNRSALRAEGFRMDEYEGTDHDDGWWVIQQLTEAQAKLLLDAPAQEPSPFDEAPNLVSLGEQFNDMTQAEAFVRRIAEDPAADAPQLTIAGQTVELDWDWKRASVRLYGRHVLIDVNARASDAFWPIWREHKAAAKNHGVAVARDSYGRYLVHWIIVAGTINRG